jgi:hypothetical protein
VAEFGELSSGSNQLLIAPHQYCLLHLISPLFQVVTCAFKHYFHGLQPVICIHPPQYSRFRQCHESNHNNKSLLGATHDSEN